MRKILFSLMTLALVVGLVGGGAFAYFSDVETSTGNTFTAGTIDLAVNNQNPWGNAEWEFTDVKPCEDLAPITLKLQNVGNNEGVLYTCIKYNESDKIWTGTQEMDVNPDFEFRSENTPPHANMELSADQFAAILYVSAVTYQYSCSADSYYGSVKNDLPNWEAMDQNSPGNNDGYVSLYELSQWSPMPYDLVDDPFPATAIIEYVITFHLADSLTNWGDVTSAIVLGVSDNRPQADGVEMIISGILLQVGAPTPPTCP